MSKQRDPEIDRMTVRRAGLLAHAASIAGREAVRLAKRGEWHAAQVAGRTAGELEAWRQELEADINRHGRHRPRDLKSPAVRTRDEAA